ncbi:pterin-4-alpha-carbinolamine dehydratase [Brevibacterium sp. 239c]|uniref:4a-hydroxytetrahydrobiopterin dehydratase n=1 Tax=Brevibacterium sp. 239c TaxID=1965356 RepID=UPI000C570E70|nr:4a-hydroxytetrahydrobiopterin dehydratase [Brevibacterium sp. 239c]SMY01873.1 pterin-4-alpha-carbinolamine dehydratase [Brevibacterium sp. 239c]
MQDRIDELTQWQSADDALHARFLTGSFVSGVTFINAIADAAEAAGHHPDVDLRFPHVDISLTTHDAGSITDKDIDLATEISQIAQSQGIDADN